MCKKKRACFVLIAFLLTGCNALPVNKSVMQSEDNFISMESEPDLSY